jgi:hypothetical protein
VCKQRIAKKEKLLLLPIARNLQAKVTGTYG